MGLALSGGGIRSATFCLGVIQAFAQRDKLKDVTYLSTVSGGGYIGSWLSAWIHRKGFSVVNQALKLNSPRDGGYVEAPEVSWLRSYSNYLAPKLGMLSADSMTLVATWLRNVLLNLFIFIAFLAICFLIPRLLVWPAEKAMHHYVEELAYASAWLGFFLFPTGISLHLSKVMSKNMDGQIELVNRTWGVLLLVILPGVLTALLATFPLFSPMTSHPGLRAPNLLRLAAVALALLAASGSLWFVYMLAEKHRLVDTVGEALVFLMAYGITIVIGLGLVVGFQQGFALLKGDVGKPPYSDSIVSAALLSFGPPALLITFGVVGWVIVGLVGRAYRERTREWWARMNAWVVIVGLVWVGLFALSFYSASIARWAYHAGLTWITPVAGAGWIGSLISTLVAKRAPEGERTFRNRVKEVALNVALAIVVVGILFGVAAGVGLTYEGLAAPPENSTPQPTASKHSSNPEPKKATAEATVVLEVKGKQGKPANISLAEEPSPEKSYASQFEKSFELQEKGSFQCFKFSTLEFTFGKADQCREGFHLPIDWLMFAVCTLVLFTFGWRVDVNKFSLHNMYKNRLIRCYLGASRHDKRRAHPFTGFDEADDLPIADLGRCEVSGKLEGPVHILNAALNITHGRNLAWQERKAASFTFTPWYCGFEMGPSTGDADVSLVPGASGMRTGGYRNSDRWASTRENEVERGERRRKFTLGTAMTISGAAVSSISGKNTRPMLGFIMTIFNARLGRWSPNPLWTKGWTRSGPSWGLLCLLKELFGYATEASKYVYLSDGGHFDNTGVYELVRRRCKTIVAVDATADVERAMGDLADIVRKCRVDFGVDIDFDLSELGTSRSQQSTSKGFVVGWIWYPTRRHSSMFGNVDTADEKGFLGTIVIIKPTLIALADLGVDVFGYSRTSESFPQQSTVDQFFSESQFESYRRLGELIAIRCLQDPAFPLH
ncbi:hypothetical protein YK56LOC_60010 [Caballeronia sp. HLA56]